MKTIKIILAATLPLLGSGLAMADETPGTGIYGTKHDWSGTGYLVPISGLEVGLCSICHTPHSALTTKLLWNQRLTTSKFTWGGETTTTGGTTLPNSANLGPSTKCLSCHDGTVAVGDTVMYKGKTDGIDTRVARIAGGSVNSVGYQGDMSRVHPIGIPYPLNHVGATYNGVTTGGNTILAEFIANPHSPTTNAVKLYKDDGNGIISPGAIEGTSGVECTSCHDPHNKQAQDFFFLRGKLAGSSATDGYICMQCHIK